MKLVKTQEATRFGLEFGFFWASDAGTVLWVGTGFVDEENRDDASEVARRGLLNIRPLDAFTKNLKPSTISVLRDWQSRRWPSSRLAA